VVDIDDDPPSHPRIPQIIRRRIRVKPPGMVRTMLNGFIDPPLENIRRVSIVGFGSAGGPTGLNASLYSVVASVTSVLCVTAFLLHSPILSIGRVTSIQ
jgi:hypothetical protein